MIWFSIFVLCAITLPAANVLQLLCDRLILTYLFIFNWEVEARTGMGDDVGWSVASYLCKSKEKNVSLGHFCYLNWSSLHMLSLHRPAGLSSPLILHIFLSSFLSCPAFLFLPPMIPEGNIACRLWHNVGRYVESNLDNWTFLD